MTSKDFLNTRAKAIFETWGKHVPGKIVFFAPEGSNNSNSEYSDQLSNTKPHVVLTSDLPVVMLRGVDDSYPPQKKSFRMLHYMNKHYIDKFEWFMRADDDLFIKTDKLEKFLRKINSTTPRFIGT